MANAPLVSQVWMKLDERLNTLAAGTFYRLCPLFIQCVAFRMFSLFHLSDFQPLKKSLLAELSNFQSDVVEIQFALSKSIKIILFNC